MAEAFWEIQGELESRNAAQKDTREICQMLQEEKLEEAQKQLAALIKERKRQQPGEVRAEKERKPTETERLISSAKEYIEEHYQENQLTVGYLAELFHVNISYLSREYRKRNEYGILEYINYLRLQKAKELLAEERTIKDIAREIGFFDTPPLMRLFRQLEGMTPGEYRNLIKKKENLKQS